MKRFSVIGITFLIALCLSLSYALAECMSPVIIDDFYAQDISIQSNYDVLLSGYIGDGTGNQVAALRSYDLDGNIMWEKTDSENRFVSYRDATCVESDTLYVIATEQNSKIEMPTYVIQCLKDGKVCVETDSYEGLNRLYLVDDGLWVDSTEIENSRSVLRKFDMNLDLMCELVLDGHIFLQVLTGDEYHIAYGYSQQQEANALHTEESILFCFDNNGNILWNSDRTPHEAYIGAIWTEPGKYTLLGRTPFNGDSNQFFSEYFLSTYDGNVHVSRINLEESTSVEGIYRKILSIHPMADGCLLPLAPIAGDDIPVLYVNVELGNCKLINTPLSIPMTLSSGQIATKDGTCYLIGSKGFRTAIVELFHDGGGVN